MVVIKKEKKVFRNFIILIGIVLIILAIKYAICNATVVKIIGFWIAGIIFLSLSYRLTTGADQPTFCHAFAPLKWKNSIILWMMSFFLNILISFFPMTWIGAIYKKSNKLEWLWVEEVWVIPLFIFLCYALFSTGLSLLSKSIIAIYVLVEVFGIAMKEIVISLQKCSDVKGEFIPVRNRLRWILMTMLNIIQIIFCFALLFLCNGQSFSPEIKKPLASLYQSILTLTTLGYGDIKPINDIGQIIVCCELIFFVLFVTIKLPIATSLIRVKKI